VNAGVVDPAPGITATDAGDAVDDLPAVVATAETRWRL
jgi:hypothetical protein